MDGPARGRCGGRPRRRPSCRRSAQREVRRVVRAQGSARRHRAAADVRLCRARLVEAPHRAVPPQRHDHDRQTRKRVPFRHERCRDQQRPARLPARDDPLPRLEASGPTLTDTQTVGRRTSLTTTRRRCSGSSRRSGSSSTKCCGMTSSRRTSCRPASRSSGPARSLMVSVLLGGGRPHCFGRLWNV